MAQLIPKINNIQHVMKTPRIKIERARKSRKASHADIAQKKGFTLIELLVVIGIIALLSSIILSSLTQARAQANNTKQIADYRVVLNALLQFKQDNGYYPSDRLSGTNTCIGSYSDGGCKQMDAVISNSPTMNTSLKKYLSSYNFVDNAVSISFTTGPAFSSANYKGFVLSCVSDDGTHCKSASLLFPALKNKNSCPQIMPDVKSGDSLLNTVADYTYCSVDLN